MAQEIVGRLVLLEMVPPVLSRALDPFPVAVRTLDALHLASIDFLRLRNSAIRVATFDARLAEAASALGLPLYPLDV